MTVNVHLGDEQGLDRSRRYLRPVARLPLPDEPDLVHLAVYEWLAMFEAWATGPALCGRSTEQGPLAEGTDATCVNCLAWKPKYERMLSPGYRAEDDDPDVLRAKLERIRADVRMLCECCGDNRERVGRVRAELGLHTGGDLRKDGEGE